MMAAAVPDSNLEKVLKTGNDQFTANMFQEVVKVNEGKSCVLSAFSVLSPLAQLALAAVGKTHDEILATIGLPNDNVIKEVFASVNTRLQSIKGVELNQASRIYVGDSYILNDEFTVMTQKIFNSEVENIDFLVKENAANEINTWVEDHTNNHIKDLIDPDCISSDTVAVLVNAIYFKGIWAKPFDKSLTSDRDFHVKQKKITVPMMYQSSEFNYTESKALDAKFLQMDYKGGETSLVVGLPNTIDGIDDLIEKIKDPAILNMALNDMSTAEVQVDLPKFKIETTTDLKEVLIKLNVTSLFEQDTARLDHLLKKLDNLYVSSAIQKAFIEVDEKGTEAAAANEAIVGLGMAYNPDVKTFNADHPFIFFLMETNNILFSGVFLP